MKLDATIHNRLKNLHSINISIFQIYVIKVELKKGKGVVSSGTFF